MRAAFLFLALVALLASSVVAWTNEDHEIFDIVAALKTSEGKHVDFYNFLNITPSATSSEVSRAYRKRSLELHPDKNQGVKNIQERFARLGTIAGILRDAEKRKRYDYFHKHGVPRWRGTGYYYSRWRPGFFTVLVFLGLASSCAQFAVQSVTYRSDLARIKSFQKRARQLAYGRSNKPSTERKRVKVPLSAGNASEDDEDGGRSGSGKQLLTMEVEGDKVWIVNDGELEPLDENTATKPSFSRTWLVLISQSLVAKIRGQRQTPPVDVDVEGPETDIKEEGEDEVEEEKAEVGDGKVNGDVKKQGAGSTVATGKVGGRRRKVPSKKR